MILNSLFFVAWTDVSTRMDMYCWLIAGCEEASSTTSFIKSIDDYAGDDTDDDDDDDNDDDDAKP